MGFCLLLAGIVVVLYLLFRAGFHAFALIAGGFIAVLFLAFVLGYGLSRKYNWDQKKTMQIQGLLLAGFLLVFFGIVWLVTAIL